LRLVGRATAPRLDLSLGSQAKVKKHAKQNEEGKMDFDCLPLTRSARGAYRQTSTLRAGFVRGQKEGKTNVKLKAKANAVRQMQSYW